MQNTDLSDEERSELIKIASIVDNQEMKQAIETWQRRTGKNLGFIIFFDGFQRSLALEAEKSTKSLYENAAIFGAASCLAENKEISDPVEQVKYLHGKFLYSASKMQWIPWAWLKHCVKVKLIKKLPNEDWAIAVCLAGSSLEGNPSLALQFIDQ